MKRPLAVMMSRQIKKVSPQASLRDAAKIMGDIGIGALLVEEAGEFIGIISETDLVRRGIAREKNLEVENVRSVMSAPVITIDIGQGASDASDAMNEHGIRHLGVTENGKITGIISVRDLLRYFKNWGA